VSKKVSITEVRKQLRTEMKAMALHYQAPVELDARFEGKLKALPAARTEAQAQYLIIAKARLLTGYQTHLLSLWAQGKIDGPRTPESLVKKADKLDNLAKFIETKGNTEKAYEYRREAIGLRSEAVELERSRARNKGTSVDSDLGEEITLARPPRQS
jgi:hypothetical protein